MLSQLLVSVLAETEYDYRAGYLLFFFLVAWFGDIVVRIFISESWSVRKAFLYIWFVLWIGLMIYALTQGAFEDPE